MNNEEADHAHHLLHGHMGVIEERAVLMNRVLICESSSWLDEGLANKRNAVHIQRHFQTMPMYSCGFWQLVLKNESHTVAFIHFDCRTGNATVVSPAVHFFHTGNQLRFDNLCAE